MLEQADYSATCSDSMCHCEDCRYCLEGFVSYSSIRNEDPISLGETVNQLRRFSCVVRRKHAVPERKSSFQARQETGPSSHVYRHYLVPATLQKPDVVGYFRIYVDTEALLLRAFLGVIIMFVAHIWMDYAWLGGAPSLTARGRSFLGNGIGIS